ncbi:low temperature requirement protein A [Pseudonocardia bannensis]|uniref:Low temperature requirement protein A n=1 Tax=Pseudonocardia bannensis TaxID=630973 RepID=A0A848DRE5_9PSEU|nr:low temperature requirement protein A [Pseudonocardia bannensis]NMH95083.1 low temperature requirement protein A [Pseudonocardia bannensis]
MGPDGPDSRYAFFVPLGSGRRGALIRTVLWWCWAGYSWLCNLVRADEGVVRVAMFVAMAALFVCAIIIVALGESIVSVGIGVAALPISWPIIVASVLGPAVTGAMWWAYFDVTSLLAERALAAAHGARRIRLARGGYTFLHLRMILGIIMMSLGLKKVLLYVGGGLRVAGGGHAGRAGARAHRLDRLRDPPLRRGAPPDPARGRPRGVIAARGQQPDRRGGLSPATSRLLSASPDQTAGSSSGARIQAAR